MTLKTLFKGTRILVKYNGTDYEIIDYTESTKLFKLQSMHENEKEKVITTAKIESLELV